VRTVLLEFPPTDLPYQPYVNGSDRGDNSNSVSPQGSRPGRSQSNF